MTPQLTAVDHFAGTGWGVACHWLGIREYGVEIMPEAIRTRRAVGFRTIYRDVWAGLFHPELVPAHNLYIASPPCQTFSVAGRGEGRKALEQVLALVVAGTWKDPVALRNAGHDLGDDRTALVLTPLAHIWAHRPQMVALEQVPTVLPVWEAIADVLRALGYSVWTGNLQAEMFGVPQTRKRAILMARLDGPVAPPVPTHSRYYSRTPERLDPGVLKWVSMAEALGWGMTARPYPTITTGTEAGGTDPAALGGSGARKNVYAERASGRWEPSGDADNDGGILRLQASDAATIQTYPWGFTNRPAVTVGNAVGRGLIGGSGAKEAVVRALADGTFIPSSGDGSNYAEATRITVAEAAVLQSYPTAFLGAGGGADERIGQKPRAIGEPAHTVTAARSAAFFEGGAWRQARPNELATLQSYPPIEMRPELAAWRWIDAPATTVAGDPRITAREHHFHGEQSATSLKLEPSEAMRFQSFPTPFPFQGGRGKQFLQIGNAVPPLLAHAILSALVATPAVRATSSETASDWDAVFAEYGTAA